MALSGNRVIARMFCYLEISAFSLTLVAQAGLRFLMLAMCFSEKSAKSVDTAACLLYYSPNIDSSRLATAQVLSPSQYLNLYNRVPQGHATILKGAVVCPFLYAIEEN